MLKEKSNFDNKTPDINEKSYIVIENHNIIKIGKISEKYLQIIKDVNDANRSPDDGDDF